MSRPHLRSIVLATVAAVPATGCPSTWNCHPDEEHFVLDREVEAGLLRDAAVPEGASPDTVSCDLVCKRAYQDSTDWVPSEIDDCALTIDGAAYTEDAPDDAVVGWIACEGVGIEGFCEGRRPLGHVEAAGHGPDEPGRTLATLAHLEAASVQAFEELAAFLISEGAPSGLVTRCHSAAEDERRHARWLGALARARGATVPTPRQVAAPATLQVVALHNAVHGCVFEAWAALEAEVAATRATDPDLRRAWARIARDEAEHAQLSWDLHAWFLGRLAAADRSAVLAAQRRALAALPARVRASCASAPPALGFPEPPRAAALATQLAARLAA